MVVVAAILGCMIGDATVTQWEGLVGRCSSSSSSSSSIVVVLVAVGCM